MSIAAHEMLLSNKNERSTHTHSLDKPTSRKLCDESLPVQIILLHDSMDVALLSYHDHRAGEQISNCQGSELYMSINCLTGKGFCFRVIKMFLNELEMLLTQCCE